MKSRHAFLLAGSLLLINMTAATQANKSTTSEKTTIIPGAERLSEYLPLLQGKRVGVFANQTSLVKNTHLVDTLRQRGIDIRVIFGPEHGFRGTADAGEKVGNYIDAKTSIPVVSLYGSKTKPEPDDVHEVDILIFDIQDVGVRFYTFISSLESFLEAALELGKPLIILDRPNPNGFYIDGPVLDKKYRSFVGRQAVPIVYGMTIGEYALMLAGEHWLSDAANAAYEKSKAQLQNKATVSAITVIRCSSYSHQSKYILPVKPSPNLPEIQSIYLYPSTCLFEGTTLSEGRGTARPFQIFGHPSLPANLWAFTPNPNEGAKSSKHYGKTCYGWDLGGPPEEVLARVNQQIQLKWLLDAYLLFPDKSQFFILPKSGKMEDSFFNKLAGNNELWQQVVQGMPEAAIRKSWEPGLKHFRQLRKKYLLYEDFP